MVSFFGKPWQRPAIPSWGWYRIGNSLQPVLHQPCKEGACGTSNDPLLLGNAAQRGSRPTCGSKSGLLLFHHLPTLYVCWVGGSKRSGAEYMGVSGSESPSAPTRLRQ